MTIFRADTLENASLVDLADDVSTAFEAGGFRPITAEIRDGALVLTSAHDYEIRRAPGVAVNNVADGADDEELLDVDGALIVNGVLVTDLLLGVDVTTGVQGYQSLVTVAVSATDGTDGSPVNTNLADLAADIDSALEDVLDGGSDGFDEIAVSVVSGRLFFSDTTPETISELEIEVLSTENAHLVGITAVDSATVIAEREPPLQRITPADPVPAAAPGSNVVLDLRIYEDVDRLDSDLSLYNATLTEATVTLSDAVTSGNTTLGELRTQLQAALDVALGPDTIVVELNAEDDRLTFTADTLFWQIKHTSENEDLLGLSPMPNDLVIANRASDKGVLPDDVTLNVWVNIGTKKIEGTVVVPKAETEDNIDISELVSDIQDSLDGVHGSVTYLDELDVAQPGYRDQSYTPYAFADFADDPVTTGGVADPLIKVKLKHSKILFTSAYDFEIRPGIPHQDETYAELVGLTRVGYGDETRASERPFNVIAEADGSTVTFSSDAPSSLVYVAGSVLSERQITMSGGADTLELDWSGRLETLDGPIDLDLGEHGLLKGDLFAGDADLLNEFHGDVILHADETLTVSGFAVAERQVILTGGVEANGTPTGTEIAGEASVTITPTGWVRTTGNDGVSQIVRVEGLNDVVVDGSIGSLRDDVDRTDADISLTPSTGTVIITEDHGWVESNGRIVIETAPSTDLEILGVVKNTGATAPDEGGGTPTADHAELVLLAPSGSISVVGDVDARGSVWIEASGAVTITGSVDAGRAETFYFVTDMRGLIDDDDADERLRIAADTVTVGGGTHTLTGAEGVLPDGLVAGETIPLLGHVASSGRLEIIGTASVDGLRVEDSGEVMIRGDGGTGLLEAPTLDIVGDIYAGAERAYVLELGDPSFAGTDGFPGGGAGVPVLAADATLRLTLELSNSRSFTIDAMVPTGTLVTDVVAVLQGALDASFDSAFSTGFVTQLSAHPSGFVDATREVSGLPPVLAEISGGSLQLVSSRPFSIDVGASTNAGFLGLPTDEATESALSRPHWIGEAAGVTMRVGDTVVFGGTALATDLDVARGDAATEGDPIDRPGTVQGTGAIVVEQIDPSDAVVVAVPEGAFLRASSELVFDAAVTDSSIDIDVDGTITVEGVVQGVDGGNDVSVVSQDSLVTVDGLVEAGDSLLVSGGTTDSLEVEGGVIITKLLFRTKRHAVHGFTLDDEGDMIDDDGFLIEVDEFGVPVLDADDPVLVPMSDEGGFLLDVFGSIIDENGNLVALDGNGDPVVDEFENPVPAEDMFGDPIPGGPSAYVRGGGAIYISTVDEIENFVNRDGYLLDENGSLIDDGAFSGGVPQLVNNAGEVVDSEGFRLDDTGRRIDVQGYLINTDGEHVDEGGMVISTEAALLLGSRTPAPTSGKVSFGLPDSQSGGTLNATGTGSRIDVHGDAFVDVHGMIGRVELDALLEVTSVTTHEVAITSEVDVGAWGDALINAKDLVEITAEDIWLMDESVTKARDEHSVSRLTATGTTEGSGGVFIARSQVYLFRALVAAGGLVEISGQEIGVHGTISVVGPALNGDGAPALVDLDSDIGIYVSGEILSGSDVTLDAGLVDASGSILIELEGRIVAGNEQDGVEGDIALEAAGEVRVIAADDASNDGLVFAPPFLTQVPVFVDVVTGYRRVEDGFVLRPVVHWIPTITTEQAGFDPVQVGSEFATIETRLFQDGYWNPTTGTFREYFIQGIDYHVENLDWPGKNSGLDVAVYEGLVDGLIGRLNGIMAGEMEFGREDFLDEGDEIRTVLNERFVTVGQTQPDVDPSPEPFAEGGSVPGFANQLAGVQAAMQQGSRGLPAVPIGGVAAVRTEFSVSEMVELAREAPFELIQDAYDDSDDGKSWTELTDSEQVNAILDHLGYKKLFDVRFLSGFRREVEVAVPGGPVHELVLLDASKASLVDGLTRAQLQQQGGRVHTQVRASFVDNRLLLGGDGALVGGGTGEAVVSAALADNQVFQLTGDSDPVFDGVVVDGGFVPGIFVEDRFAPTLSGVADLASQLGLSVVMETRVEEKTYFDFWFPDGVISENFMEERGIVPEDVFRRGNRDDGDAANDNDYDEDYGTPGDPDYIPSLSERMDTILAEGGWEKVYSRDDGRGVIHRNFEGTPTVHLWEPEWMGNRRQIVPYTLDDGTDIFLRVPCGYEEYHVTAVGNDHIYEPDPPGSSPWKLQYVGDVHTYYETVGGFRQVADVLYEQEWSTLQRENQPTNPVRYDSYYSSDEDELGITDGEEGWVATYIADTGYDEYSIFDGRQADDHGVNGRFELFETLITRTGPIFAEFDGEPGGGAGDGAGAAVLNLELLSPEIIAGLVDLDVSTGGSVIKYWDKPPEWDISDDANNANGSNRGSVGTSGGIVGGFEGGSGGPVLWCRLAGDFVYADRVLRNPAPTTRFGGSDASNELGEHGEKQALVTHPRVWLSH